MDGYFKILCTTIVIDGVEKKQLLIVDPQFRIQSHIQKKKRERKKKILLLIHVRVEKTCTSVSAKGKQPVTSTQVYILTS